METLAAQFDNCLTRIAIDPTEAAKAHKEVRGVLERDQQLRDWGVDTILIGSYARDVSIYPCGDVDVFVKLPKCTNSDPDAVFRAVERVLVGHYKERAQEQRRSMMVTGFPQGLCVDAVAAVRDAGAWQIPDTDTGKTKNKWERTDPERVTQLTQERNAASPFVNGRGSYVPIVKLVRQIREAHLEGAKPGGLYFELMTYRVFERGIQGTSYAELLAVALAAIKEDLLHGVLPVDPALGSAFCPAPSAQELAGARNLFATLSDKASQAVRAEKCPAAALWRNVMGRNPRGSVFPLPDGCDESGKSIASITVNQDRGSDESRPFA